MNRDSSIDIARGIGIILVVWAHTQMSNVIFSFHMPLFFFLSGLFFKIESAKDFVNKKYRTLAIPLIFFYIVSLLLKIPFQYITKSQEDTVKKIFSGEIFQLTTVDVTLWFIVCLLVIDILLYSIARTVKKEYRRSIIICSLFVIGYLLSTYFENPIYLPFYIGQALVCLPFTYLGWCYNRFVHIKSNKMHLIWLIIFGLLFVGSICIFSPQTNLLHFVLHNNPVGYLLPAICGTMLVFYLSKILSNYKTFITTTLEELGKYSLFIMAISEDVRFPFMYKWARKIPYFDVILGTTIIVTISLLCGIILKKYFPYLWTYKVPFPSIKRK